MGDGLKINKDQMDIISAVWKVSEPIFNSGSILMYKLEDVEVEGEEAEKRKCW